MKIMPRVLYVSGNQLRQLVADVKLSLGIYKYILAEQHDAVILKQGKNGILGGFVVAEGHHKIFGSAEHGYEDVRVCLEDFRRGMEKQKKDEKLPRFLQDFELGRNSRDISDLCGMSQHCAEGEALDRELTQLIRLAKKYHGKFTKIWYCGEKCALNYPSAN